MKPLRKKAAKRRLKGPDPSPESGASTVASLNGTIELPPGLPPSLLGQVRERAREAMQGRWTGPGTPVEFKVDLPLQVEVTSAAPKAGVVSPETQVRLTTSARRGDKTDEAELPFRVATAPDPRLEALWGSVIGCSRVKQELLDATVKMARHRDGFARIAHLVQATGKYLFAGAPGTAKTTLARSLADPLARALGGEVAVFEVHTPTLLSKYVGESAQNVAKLFDQVRDAAARHEHAVVVVDEYDALAVDRYNEQEHPDAKRAVNALLMEMDRLSFVEHGTVLIAVSNVADQTDPAVLRRFDQVFQFDRPDAKVRAAILYDKLTKAVDGMDLDLQVGKRAIQVAAKQSDGYSGADLARIVGKAVLLALDDGRLDTGCLKQALDEVKPARFVLNTGEGCT